MLDRDRLSKAPSFGTPGLGVPATKEPSRWHTNTPGHFPNYSGHKMRARAAAGMGEAQAFVIAVNKLFRTQDEFGRPPPHVITVEDVTRGIVIDPVDQQKIQRLVGGTSAHFDQKSQTQRIFHARGRLHETLRHSYKHIDSDTRMELVRRAVAYWRRNGQTAYGKDPTIRWGKGMERSMRLVVPLKKGGPFIGPHEEPDPMPRTDKSMDAIANLDLLSKGGPYIGPKGGKQGLKKARKARGGAYKMRVVLPSGKLKFFYDHGAYERWCDRNDVEPHISGERKAVDDAARRGHALVSDGPPQANTYGYDKLEDDVPRKPGRYDDLQAKMHAKMHGKRGRGRRTAPSATVPDGDFGPRPRRSSRGDGNQGLRRVEDHGGTSAPGTTAPTRRRPSGRSSIPHSGVVDRPGTPNKNDRGSASPNRTTPYAKMTDGDYAQLGAFMCGRPRAKKSDLVRPDLLKHTESKLVYRTPQSRRICLEW